MKKIAIFTEGETELIFIRECLLKMYNHTNINVSCYKLIAQDSVSVPYEYKTPEPKIAFVIFCVENDQRVLSEIKGRESNLISKGYNMVIGVRDMYSELYKKELKKRSLPSGKVNNDVNMYFIGLVESEIKKMKNSGLIKVVFSIMEVESWFLSIKGLFEKIDSKLSEDEIKKRVGFDVDSDYVESIFKPANIIDKIFKVIGSNYRKSSNDVEKIVRCIDKKDIEEIIKNKKSKSFAIFHALIC